jgi:hypothetical protein
MPIYISSLKGYQLISTSIWSDQRFPYLSGDAQLVWFFLFTHPLCRQIGIYKASLSGLYDELNVNSSWTRDRYDVALETLEKDGLILLDRKNLLVAFPKFFSSSNTQNHPHNLNQARHLLKAFCALPTSTVTEHCFFKFLEALRPYGKRLGKPFTKRLAELLVQPLPKRMVMDIVSFLLEESPEEESGLYDDSPKNA